MNQIHCTRVLLRTRVHTEEKHVVNFQERVQQLERQLKEMEREKERELNSLRKEKRELIHTGQMVRTVAITSTKAVCQLFRYSLASEKRFGSSAATTLSAYLIS